MMVENSNDGTNWIQLKHNINLNLCHFEPLEGIILCCKPVGEQNVARESFGARERFGAKEHFGAREQLPDFRQRV